MSCDKIIEDLKANASEKYKANVVKMGIPKEYSIGVCTAVYHPLTATPFKRNTSYTKLSLYKELHPYIRCYWGTEKTIIQNKKMLRRNYQREKSKREKYK